MKINVKTKKILIRLMYFVIFICIFATVSLAIKIAKPKDSGITTAKEINDNIITDITNGLNLQNQAVYLDGMFVVNDSLNSLFNLNLKSAVFPVMVLYTKCIIIVFLFYVWCGSSICRSTDIRCGLYCYAKLARVDGMTRIGINQEVFLTVFNFGCRLTRGDSRCRYIALAVIRKAVFQPVRGEGAGQLLFVVVVIQIPAARGAEHFSNLIDIVRSRMQIPAALFQFRDLQIYGVTINTHLADIGAHVQNTGILHFEFYPLLVLRRDADFQFFG